MADTMQFDLVAPERRVASVEVTSVKIPAMEGDLTAMPGHLPMITTLRPGVVVVEGPDGNDEFIVTGGFAEINGESIAVLAEESYHRDEMSQEILDSMITRMNERQQKAVEASQNEPGPADDVAKLMSDMVGMGNHIGLDTNQANL